MPTSEYEEIESRPRSMEEGMRRWLLEIDTTGIPKEYKEKIDYYLMTINKHPALSNIKRQDIPYFIKHFIYVRQLIAAKRPLLLQRAISELLLIATELDLTRGVDFAWTKTTQAETKRVEMREQAPKSRLGRLFGGGAE